MILVEIKVDDIGLIRYGMKWGCNRLMIGGEVMEIVEVIDDYTVLVAR